VGIETDPRPPRVGENTLTIVVRDSVDRPVRQAEVEVVVSMSAMGAMPYMESRGRVREPSPGVYRVAYGLAMNGDWDGMLRVRPRGGTPVETAFRISTQLPDVAMMDGTPPAGGGPGAAVGPGAGGAEVEGIVALDPARRQSLGVRVDTLRVRDLVVDLHAAGRVAYDETRRSEVSLKYSGWVRQSLVDFTGAAVNRGDPLFTAYSPEVYAAQQEYLEALRPAAGDSLSGAGRELAEAARHRLLLWDLAPSDVDAIARSGRPRETFPVRAQSSGAVVEKNVVQGSPFQAGQILYRIAPTDPVWVLASIYQQDLPRVRVGLAARVTDPYSDRGQRAGRVSFVSPSVEGDSRTGTVRIEVPNPRHDLKPGMFVNVELRVPLGPRLALPESAVLPTGERRLVFVDLGDGRFAPREVRLGARAGGYYEVLQGLVPGDAVVTSGNFLVAAESKLRSATGKW
jgi:Cu(I)/Ag(I) efflux system membrane fusion protein